MACHRLVAQSAAHSQHFRPESWQDAFEIIPQHVSELTASDLHRAGVITGKQWMVIAYWAGKDNEAGHAAQKVANLLLDLCGQVAQGLLLG